MASEVRRSISRHGSPPASYCSLVTQSKCDTSCDVTVVLHHLGERQRYTRTTDAVFPRSKKRTAHAAISQTELAAGGGSPGLAQNLVQSMHLRNAGTR